MDPDWTLRWITPGFLRLDRNHFARARIAPLVRIAFPHREGTEAAKLYPPAFSQALSDRVEDGVNNPFHVDL